MAFKMKGFPMMATSAFKQNNDDSKSSKKVNTPKRIYVDDSNKVDSYVSEDEFESKFKKIEGDASTFPQYSVEDYSKVKVDKDGRKYVEHLGT
tara:strand:+ start:123 stop:401 length:279 start_codon:yes stop_codon:yes gene_type:complete